MFFMEDHCASTYSWTRCRRVVLKLPRSWFSVDDTVIKKTWFWELTRAAVSDTVSSNITLPSSTKMKKYKDMNLWSMCRAPRSILVNSFIHFPYLIRPGRTVSYHKHSPEITTTHPHRPVNWEIWCRITISILESEDLEEADTCTRRRLTDQVIKSTFSAASKHKYLNIQSH